MQQNETATSTVLLNGEQAKNELNELEVKTKSLRKSLREAMEVGDLTGIKRYNKELKDTQQQMRSVKGEAFDAKKVLDNISGSSLKDLYAARKKIDSLLKNGTVKRSTAEWRELAESQRKIKKEISAVNAEMSVGQSRMSSWANGVNKYFNIVLSGVAAVTGMSFALRKLAEDVAKMDDVYADVMKVTNMTREQVVELNEAFKKFDTRTPREELNKLAWAAGKLGYTAKKDILDFSEAGNQIKVALGEDLGEDAIKNIGKMVNVFQHSTKELQGIQLKEQMLAVGSAINELGMSSTASEPYLVQFAARMGGVSKQAKISMADIMGFASSLDQDMQAVEMSATALQKFIMKVMGDPAKFAKMAGIEVKAFTDLLSTDANAAIKLVLKSLNEKGGFQQLIPLFKDMGLDGARAVGVLSSLAGSIGQVDEAQRIAHKAMEEGTSVTNEYKIKNENLAAQLEKARKKFKEVSLELGESLNPVLLKSTKGTTYLIRVMVELPKWLKENRVVIISLITTWLTYILAVNRATIATKLMEFWNGKVITSFKAVGAAIKANPWGLIATGLILALAWLNKYLNKQREVNLEQAEFLTLAEQTKELFADTKSLEDRAKAMKSLSKTQLESLQSNLENQISVLEEHDAKIKAMSQKALDEDKELQNLKTKFNNAKTDMEKAAFAAPIRWREQRLLEGLSKEYFINQKSLKQLTKYKGDVEKLLKTKTTPETTPTDDNVENTYKGAEKALEVTSKIRQLELLNMYQNMQITEQMYNQLSEAEMLLALEEKLKLQKQYGEETIDTELAIANAKLKISKGDIKSREDHKKLIDSMTLKSPLEIDEELDDSDIVAYKEKYDRFLKLKEKYDIGELEDFKTQKELELQILQEYLDKGIISEKEAAEVRAHLASKEFEIKTKEAKEAAQEIAHIAADLSSALQGFQAAEERKIETRYQGEIDAARKAGKDTTEIEERKNKELAELRAKNADAMFALQVAGIIASTAAAAIDAYASALKIPVVGLALAPIAAGAAVAFGFSQVAQANAAREAAKEGYAQGGFTTPGGKYQPAGIVHAGEFVGNQDAVNHRPVRKVFNLIDHAQRTNSIGRITEETIMHALSKPKGYAEGGFVTSSIPPSQGGLTKEDIAMAISGAMAESTAVNAALLMEIQKGIKAKVSASGQDGVISAIETYNKLIKNAKG